MRQTVCPCAKEVKTLFKCLTSSPFRRDGISNFIKTTKSFRFHGICDSLCICSVFRSILLGNISFFFIIFNFNNSLIRFEKGSQDNDNFKQWINLSTEMASFRLSLIASRSICWPSDGRKFFERIEPKSSKFNLNIWMISFSFVCFSVVHEIRSVHKPHEYVPTA